MTARGVAVSDTGAAPPEAMAVVPVSELRKLAELLGQLDIDLADDLIAGLANRMLRSLARRWADTVSLWAVEAELWGETRAGGVAPGDAGSGPGVAGLSEAELRTLIRAAVAQLAARQGRSPGAVLSDFAAGAE